MDVINEITAISEAQCEIALILHVVLNIGGMSFCRS